MSTSDIIVQKKDISSVNQISAILKAYLINEDPLFVTQTVFGNFEQENLDTVKSYLNSKEFIELATKTRLESEVYGTQNIDTLKISYKVLLVELRNKLSKDIMHKIKVADDSGKQLALKAGTVAELERVMKLEFMLHGLPTNTSMSIKKDLDAKPEENMEIDVTEAKARLGVIERNRKKESMVQLAKDDKLGTTLLGDDDEDEAEIIEDDETPEEPKKGFSFQDITSENRTSAAQT